MHPDSATLLAYRDRELGKDLAREIERHLAACAECAGRLERLSEEWDLILAADAVFRSRCMPPPDGLDRLLSAIQECGRPVARPVEPAELKRRIAEQLEVYFGSRISAVLDTVPASPHLAENLLARVEPLLTTFLGRKAAAAVIAEIMKGLDPQSCLTPGVV